VAQSNPGGRPGTLIILCVCCAFAELAVSPVNVPRLISAIKTPATTTNSPIKTRTLKKANCEADFFFIGGSDADGWIFKCGASLLAKTPQTRQHFFLIFGVIALGFYWARKSMASLFSSFWNRGLPGPHGFLPAGKGKDSDANGNSAVTILRNRSKCAHVLAPSIARQELFTGGKRAKRFLPKATKKTKILIDWFLNPFVLFASFC